MILLIKQFSSLYLTALIDWCVARYEAVEQEQTALEKPYTALAQMLSCEPDEIAVVTSATTAWQQVWNLKGAAAISLLHMAHPSARSHVPAF